MLTARPTGHGLQLITGLVTTVLGHSGGLDCGVLCHNLTMLENKE